MVTTLLRMCRAVLTKPDYFIKLTAGVTIFAATAAAQTPPSWLFAGADIEDSRAMLSPVSAQQITPATVPNIRIKWIFHSNAPIMATPTVEAGGLYVTDQIGTLYKINPSTGAYIWGNRTSTYTGVASAGNRNRASPAIGSQGEIVVGDGSSPTVFSVSRTTGDLIWKTVVDSNTASYIRGSPVIYNGIVYIGVASGEEGNVITDPTYQFSFRGSIVALDEQTGRPLWKFYTVPSGYTGGAVWSSQPVVFTATNSLIFGTGNNYTVPASVAACITASGTTASQQLKNGVACLDPQDLIDAVVSVDLTTGNLNWSRRLQGVDTFNGACELGTAQCPNPPGPDFDFSSAPNLVKLPDFVGVVDDRGGLSQSYLLGIGQKSGMYYGINPYTGGLFWSTLVGTEVIKWGTAVNTTTNSQALVAIENPDHVSNVLVALNGVKSTWSAGSWGSIDLKTGKMLWQIPARGRDLTNPSFGADAPSAITYSNNVGFASGTSGYMAAFNASTGQVLQTYNTGASISSAPAVYNDTIYWGAGSATDSTGRLYAFAIPPAAATSAAVAASR